MSKKILSLGVGLLWSLISTLPSQAQMNYSEKKSKNQQHTSSSAMRGCRRNLPKLQLLAPADQIAVMGEKRTFLLSLSELPPYPLKFSVLEPYVPEALWRQELKVQAPGIFQISLPAHLNLAAEQNYILTVTIPCDPEIPGSSSYVRVLFQKSTVQYQEKQPIAQVSRLLAEGIWYDALWIAYQHELPEFRQLLQMQGIELN